MSHESLETRVEGAVARYQGPLVLYAQRFLGGDVARARDVVQETFLKLCRHRAANGELRPERLPAWLYTVCRRAALDVRRKEKRMTLMTDETADRMQSPAAVDPAAAAETGDSAARVMSMVERLPDGQKEAIVLKFGHGLSYKEIAQVMGQSVSNVGVLIHNGLKAVRERLGVGIVAEDKR